MEKTAIMNQHENGTYEAEIRDQYGDVESAITAKTPSEIWQWAEEHGVRISNVFLKS